MSICDPQIEGIPRSTINDEFPLRCNSFFSKNRRLNSFIHSTWVKENHSTCKRVLLRKIGGFLSCVTIPRVRKILKNAITFEISHYSKSIIPAVTALSSVTISKKKSEYCRGGFDSKTININPCIKILIVQKFQKVVTKIDSFRLSKRCFSVTTVLISFMRVTINNLTFAEKEAFQLSIIPFFASKSGKSQESKIFYCIDFVDIQSRVFL